MSPWNNDKKNKNEDESNDALRDKVLAKFEHYQKMAEIYYAYQHIHRFVVRLTF